MQLKYSYYYFKEAISPETCQRIIELGTSRLQEAENRGIDTSAITFGGQEKSAKPDAMPQGEMTLESVKNSSKNVSDVYVRDSNVVWMNDQWLYDLLQPFIHEANKLAGWNWQWDYSETFQFTAYKPNQFYSWHKDGSSDHHGIYKRYIHGITNVPLKSNGRLPSGYTTEEGMIGKIRKISMTINLNAPGEYEGGNLKFDFGHHAEGERFHECEEIRPQGSIIVFPSFIDHCVTPVTSGTRYSLVLWSLGEPFK